MQATCTFDVAMRPDDVVAYLSDPRHLLLANHRGPVIEQSDQQASRAGSWSVLAFDQLRVRVEYTAFDPPGLIAASIATSGRGSGAMHGAFVYRLAPIPATGGTRITLDAESEGGWMPGPISRLFWPVMWRQLRRRMETSLRRSN